MNKNKSDKFYKLFILTPAALQKFKEALSFMRRNNINSPIKLNSLGENAQRHLYLNKLNEDLGKKLKDTSIATNHIISKLKNNLDADVSPRNVSTADSSTQHHIISRNKDTQTKTVGDEDEDEFQMAINENDFTEALDPEEARRSSLRNFIPENIYENIPLLNETEKNNNSTFNEIDLDDEQKEFINNLKEAGLGEKLDNLEIKGFDNDDSFVNVNVKGNDSFYMIAKPKRKGRITRARTRQTTKNMKNTTIQSEKKNYKDAWSTYERFRLRR